MWLKQNKEVYWVQQFNEAIIEKLYKGFGFKGKSRLIKLRSAT